ncbi:MAG: SRPBCC family protein [Acidimicrobiia bacterium]|nr:SRPBCC family protein [Acidimicrobiia bacterium]
MVDRPIGEVFEVASDFGRAGEWRKGIRDAGLVDPDPGVGARYTWVVKFGWQTMDLGGQLTEWDPPARFRWKPTAGPFPVAGGMDFVAEGTATRVRTFSNSEPTGLMKMLTGVMKRIGERQYRQELATLKQLVEGA